MVLTEFLSVLSFEFESKDESSGVVVGAYKWSNGDKYVGTWKHGKRHGKVSLLIQSYDLP
jgi:hypothetical protein